MTRLVISLAIYSSDDPRGGLYNWWHFQHPHLPLGARSDSCCKIVQLCQEGLHCVTPITNRVYQCGVPYYVIQSVNVACRCRRRGQICNGFCALTLHGLLCLASGCSPLLPASVRIVRSLRGLVLISTQYDALFEVTVAVQGSNVFPSEAARPLRVLL